jgi:SAM-dependent methyltransferase
MSRRVTGERAVTGEGGFNPSWQRHVAGYAYAASVLGPGRLLDLGCGTGHSFHLLAPRETIGVDVAPEALEGQDRETVIADMRELPFEDESFDSVIAAHSVEHVPDPNAVLAEAARVLRADGTAIFTTPNRLTFGRPDEIIDPYHHVEFDEHELRELCSRHFEEVELLGVFGSERYMELHRAERVKLEGLLRKDPLRLRRLIPRRVRQRLYDRRLSKERLDHGDPRAAEIELADFPVRDGPLDESLDLIALCRRPGRKGSAMRI